MGTSKSRYNDGIHQYRKVIGDTWKYLMGYTAQEIEHASGHARITFIKQVQNVLVAFYLIQFDDGATELSEEFVYEIIEDYV